MKAYRLTQHLMAIILIVAIAIGLLPAVALGAERSSAIPVDSEAKLQQTISSARDHEDTIIEITQNIFLSKTIYIPRDKKITIQGTHGKEITIQPRGDASDDLAAGLFVVGDWTNGAATASFANVILDGGRAHRLINSLSGSQLALQDVTIRYGRSSGASQHGAGIYMGGGTILANRVFFTGNVKDKGTVLLSCRNLK